MVDREISGEVNVKIDQRKPVTGWRPEGSGEWQCSQQPACDAGAFEECSAFHKD